MSLSCLYIMPTLRCNCRCAYCYIPETEKKADENSDHFIPVLEKYIAEAAQSTPPFSPQLRFIGGEPYLRLDLLRVLASRFLAAFPGHLVVINSNVTLLDAEAVSYWSGLGKNIAHIASLDGLRETHDRRRILLSGRGSFDKTDAGIRLLQAAGLTVYCNMVLDRDNAPELDAFFDFLAGELGMKEVAVSLRSQDGYWNGAGEEFALLEKAYAAAAARGITLTGHHRVHLGAHIPGLRCRAGEKTLVITPQGSFYACQRFVGKTRGAPVDLSRSLADHRDSLQDSSACIDAESTALGENLYLLYRERFPDYLRVTDLDRIFFGVIQEGDGP